MTTYPERLEAAKIEVSLTTKPVVLVRFQCEACNDADGRSRAPIATVYATSEGHLFVASRTLAGPFVSDARDYAEAAGLASTVVPRANEGTAVLLTVPIDDRLDANGFPVPGTVWAWCHRHGDMEIDDTIARSAVVAGTQRGRLKYVQKIMPKNAHQPERTR